MFVVIPDGDEGVIVSFLKDPNVGKLSTESTMSGCDFDFDCDNCNFDCDFVFFLVSVT